MQVIGFDGKDYKLNLTKYLNKQRAASSSLHKMAREMLVEIFPNLNIYEEVRLPGTKDGIRSRELFSDFFIPSVDLMVEVHGRQHYEYCSHYHSNQLEFARSKQRDNQKRYWCEINNIQYIELPYNESATEWRVRIESR